MLTSDFSYELPEALIAQKPLPARSASRMMVLRRAAGTIEHRNVADLPLLLDPSDLLVINNTRVIPARLFGTRLDTGGRVELLLVEEADPGVWSCMFRASGRASPGMKLVLASGRIGAEVLEPEGAGRYRIRFTADRPMLEVLEEEGLPPLPPYIKRPRVAGQSSSSSSSSIDLRGRKEDRERYQTVYAREPGAVAAPTAGLHFDRPLLDAIAARGIAAAEVTLHVGPGTFKPVTAGRVEDHVMEPERYALPPETAEAVAAARGRGGRVVAVGSTSVRTLETMANDDGTVRAGEGRTDIFIHPPFRFRATDAILTNFHLPRSTLLMMVCAFGGMELVMKAYTEAVRERYRFYSYGDCMLVV